MKAASVRNEERMLTELSGKDENAVVAYEIVYHRTCYKDFTRGAAKSTNEDKAMVWQKFEDYIEEHLLIAGEVNS